MTRRGWTLLASLLTFMALVGAAVTLPVPYIRMAPGPTFNVICDVGNYPVIEITGTQTYPAAGEIDLTTVRESGGPRGGLTFVQAIGAWFSDSDAVVPQELIYPDDVTGEDLRRRQAVLFSTSGSNAVAAALNYLELPINTDVVVSGVELESPSTSVFEPRDIIVRMDGVTITEPGQVVDAVRAQPIGTTFNFEVRREVDGTASDIPLTVTSAANPDDPALPYIGITVSTLFTGDFDIRLNLEDVGGPSAGLVFSLGIIDKLTPEDLTDGKSIAATGTITPTGEVGPVGGIRQKMAGARAEGAELFLMPVRQCAEAQGRIPVGLTVVPVTTLAEAVDSIRAWLDGKTLPTCPVQRSDET
jgi:PDZ domain-containing protein